MRNALSNAVRCLIALLPVAKRCPVATGYTGQAGIGKTAAMCTYAAPRVANRNHDDGFVSGSHQADRQLK